MIFLIKVLSKLISKVKTSGVSSKENLLDLDAISLIELSSFTAIKSDLFVTIDKLSQSMRHLIFVHTIS